MRTTNQQVIIQETVERSKGHASVGEVFQRARRRLPKLSLATVYRVLNRLVSEMRLSEVIIDGITLYEANSNPHMHFVCLNCRDIQDIALDKRAKELLDSMAGHERRISEFQIVAQGTCQKCAVRPKKG